MKQTLSIRWRKLLPLLLLTAGLTACTVQVPSDIIGEKEMEELLYDYHLMQAMASDLGGGDAVARKQYEQFVYDKHGVTEAEFDSSLVWYTRHTKELEAIYKRLEKRLMVRKEALTALIRPADRANSVTEAGDTVNIWNDYRLQRLTASSPLCDKVTFALPADSNFRAYDLFEWNVRAHFLSNDTTRTRAVMAMTLLTDQDTLGISTPLTASARYTLTLRCDSGYMPKKLMGHIYYYPLAGQQQPDTLQRDSLAGDTALPSLPPADLLLSEISLMRYHCTDSLLMNGGKKPEAPDSLTTAPPATDAQPSAKEAPSPKKEEQEAAPAKAVKPGKERKVFLKNKKNTEVIHLEEQHKEMIHLEEKRR